MNRTEAAMKLIQTFALLQFNRKEQIRAIQDVLGYEKPIRDMDKQEIEKVLQSIMGE